MKLGVWWRRPEPGPGLAFCRCPRQVVLEIPQPPGRRRESPPWKAGRLSLQRTPDSADPEPGDPSARDQTSETPRWGLRGPRRRPGRVQRAPQSALWRGPGASEASSRAPPALAQLRIPHPPGRLAAEGPRALRQSPTLREPQTAPAQGAGHRAHGHAPRRSGRGRDPVRPRPRRSLQNRTDGAAGRAPSRHHHARLGGPSAGRVRT